MKPYFSLALAKNLETAKSDRGGTDGQMHRPAPGSADARAARNLRHVEAGGAPRKGRIMRDRNRQPKQVLEAGQETLGLAQWHREHRAQA